MAEFISSAAASAASVVSSAATSAMKRLSVAAVRLDKVEPMMEIKTDSITGNIFTCALLSKDDSSNSVTKQKRLLAITYSHQFVEMVLNPYRPGYATTMEVHELQALVKLRYKKDNAGVVTFHFSGGKVLRYYMEDATECIDTIKRAMAKEGIKGTVRNTKKAAASRSAEEFFEATKDLEAQFLINPDIKIVQEIMDLLRQSTERFGEADDSRYMEIVSYIQNFLRREDVGQVLDAASKIAAEERKREMMMKAREEDPDAMLRNAKQLSFDEDDAQNRLTMDMYRSSRVKEGINASDPTDALEDELETMLGDMNNEFSNLLQSFEQKNGRPISVNIKAPTSAPKETEGDEAPHGLSDYVDFDICDVYEGEDVKRKSMGRNMSMSAARFSDSGMDPNSLDDMYGSGGEGKEGFSGNSERISFTNARDAIGIGTNPLSRP
jgi:hypothetical protein